MPTRSEQTTTLPDLISTPMARAAGLTRDQVRQRHRSGEWIRLGGGWYVSAGSLADLAPHDRECVLHAMSARAAARRHRGSTICGASAAIVHGMPIAAPPPPEVQLVGGTGSWTGRRAGVAVRRWPMPDAHLDRASFRITTPARTCVDLARCSSVATALAAGDHALRCGQVTAHDLRHIADDLDGTRGLARAHVVLGLLDPLRETPLESASAAYFHRHRLPRPRWQVVIVDESGMFLGRVDCYWDDAHLIGEADGRLKYATGNAVYAEKRREDALRGTGRALVRWGWQDLHDSRLAERLRVAMARPAGSVTGTALR